MPIKRKGANTNRKRKFVPFGSEPRKDRPTAKESRGEINAIRKYSNTRNYKDKYEGAGKTVYKRSS